MAQTAAHLVDQVTPPHMPVRQWVHIGVMKLFTPHRLPPLAQPELITPVLQVVHRVLTRFLSGRLG